MSLFLTESNKSPAEVAKSNKQWAGTCGYSVQNCGTKRIADICLAESEEGYDGDQI